MTTLRITDYNGSILIVDINETPEEFNRRIDEAWNTRKYSIPIGTRFDRVDVRNIASITEIKNESPAQPEIPEEEQTPEPEPEEPTEEEPADDETNEPIEEPEPSEDN